MIGWRQFSQSLWWFVESAAKSVIADDNAGERVSLNNVKVDSPLNLDSTGSTDHDGDESEVSSEADEDSPNKDSTGKKRKKISNYSCHVL